MAALAIKKEDALPAWLRDREVIPMGWLRSIQPSEVFFAGTRQLSLAPRGEVCFLKTMGHCKGKDNVKLRLKRRKKTERLALAKSIATAAAK